MVGVRGLSTIVTCSVAVGGMLVVFSGDADAARRGREVFHYCRLGRWSAARCRAVTGSSTSGATGTTGDGRCYPPSQEATRLR